MWGERYWQVPEALGEVEVGAHIMKPEAPPPPYSVASLGGIQARASALSVGTCCTSREYELGGEK